MTQSKALGQFTIWSIGIFLTSLLLQFLLLPTEFVGPDTPKYLELAQKAQSWSFWIDPNAFDGNYWPIGYPIFAATVWTLYGSVDIYAIQVVQIFISSSFVFLTAPFTRGFSVKLRIIAAFLVGVSPSVIGIGQTGGYELLLGFLLLVSLGVLWGTQGKPTGNDFWLSWAGPVLAGFTLGLAFLVQNKVIIVTPVLLYLALRWGKRPLVYFVISACIAPFAWALRNLMIRGSFDPRSTNGPVNIWIGNNPESVAGGFMEPLPLPPNSTSFIDAALRFIINQPEASAALYLRKVARLLEPVYLYPEFDQPPGFSTVLHYSTFLLSVILLFLFFAYLFAMIWRTNIGIPSLLPLAIFYLLFVLVNLPFLAEARYRTPLEPLLISISVITASALWRRYTQRRFKQPVQVKD